MKTFTTLLIAVTDMHVLGVKSHVLGVKSLIDTWYLSHVKCYNEVLRESYKSTSGAPWNAESKQFYERKLAKYDAEG